AEVAEFGARNLNRFEIIGKRRQFRKRMTSVGGAKRRGLRGQWHVRGRAHFAKQWPHPFRVLLAVCTDRNRTQPSHDLSALRGRMIIAALRDPWAKTHRGDRWQTRLGS